MITHSLSLQLIFTGLSCSESLSCHHGVSLSVFVSLAGFEECFEILSS